MRKFGNFGRRARETGDKRTATFSFSNLVKRTSEAYSFNYKQQLCMQCYSSYGCSLPTHLNVVQHSAKHQSHRLIQIGKKNDWGWSFLIRVGTRICGGHELASIRQCNLFAGAQSNENQIAVCWICFCLYHLKIIFGFINFLLMNLFLGQFIVFISNPSPILYGLDRTKFG